MKHFLKEVFGGMCIMCTNIPTDIIYLHILISQKHIYNFILYIYENLQGYIYLIIYYYNYLLL